MSTIAFMMDMVVIARWCSCCRIYSVPGAPNKLLKRGMYLPVPYPKLVMQIQVRRLFRSSAFRKYNLHDSFARMAFYSVLRNICRERRVLVWICWGRKVWIGFRQLVFIFTTNKILKLKCRFQSTVMYTCKMLLHYTALQCGNHNLTHSMP